ncbi:MAG: hypothetical protein J7L41_02230 [Synergistetes bacterium]|nr:hypothetical protein [Synergistota bacterium]
MDKGDSMFKTGSKANIRGKLQYVAMIIFFVCISIIMTYPVVRDMFYGYVVAQFHDDLISIWTLMWDIHSILQNGLNVEQLFDANVFYSYKLTLAFSEHQIFTALMGLPLYLITRSAIVMYGILTILPFALSGITMFVLVKHLTKSYLAGIVGGIIFSFIPYKMWCIHQIQNMMTMWMPLTLLCLHKFYERYKYRYMIYASIFFVFTALSSGYYMMYFSVFIGLFIVFYGFYYRILVAGKHILSVILFIGISMSFIFPFYYPYIILRGLYGMTRSIWEVEWYSATVKSYYSTFSWYKVIKGLHFLGDRPAFIGFLPIGLILYLLGRIKMKVAMYHNIFFYTLFTVLAILLSFGPYIKLHSLVIPNVYLLLYKFVPGFCGLREPSRFVVFVALGVAILVAYSISFLEKKLRKKWLLWSIPLLILVEYASFPLSMVRLPYDKKDLPVISWLSKQKGNFAIFEVPYSISEMPFYMYYSTYHWKRIVSAFNTNLPPIQQILGVSNFEKKLSVLKSINVKYVVVYKMWYSKSDIGRLVKVGGDSLRKVYEDEKSIVYEITDRDRNFIPYGTKLSSHRFSVYIPHSLPSNRWSVVVLKLLDEKPVVFLDRKMVSLVWKDRTNREVYREKVAIEAQKLAFMEPHKCIVGKFKVPNLPVGRYVVEVCDIGGGLIGRCIVNIVHRVKYWNCQPLPDDGYRVKFIAVDLPRAFLGGRTIRVSVTFKNVSRYDWITYADNRWQRLNYRTAVSIPTLYNIHLSYHWLDVRTGKTVVFDGNRAVLPCVVKSGEVIKVPLMVRAPGRRGKYVLEITLVQEGVSWFERKGASVFRKVVFVK